MRAQRAFDVVALGGGHGLAASLRALRRVTAHLTAVVGVSDNGGSSGRLRDEFHVVPPGDLRMALAALCGDDTWGATWARVLQHRFHSAGDLNDHALGNLLITALWEETGDIVEGLDWVARLLDAKGKVLPLALEPLEIIGEVRTPDGLTSVRGQVQVATTAHEIQSIKIEPANPQVCLQAIKSVLDADVVVLGPGSWWSSVLTHLQVPEMREALVRTTAQRILVLNLMPQAGETDGYLAHQYVADLHTQVPQLNLDVVIADPQHVRDHELLVNTAALLGAEVEFAELSVGSEGIDKHDPAKLASAFERAFIQGRTGTWQ
jgi:uncharacterized cofD-like protein